MRPHIDAAWQAGREVYRSHMVEKDERPDHAAARRGQDPADLEAAKIATALLDRQVGHAMFPLSHPVV